MAADFEISSLSGTGTATIRVKPKAVNEDMNNIKEQVLKVVVQGVEREVTLVQRPLLNSRDLGTYLVSLQKLLPILRWY